MRATLLTPPAGALLSLDEVKAWLRLDGDAEDDDLAALVATACALVESRTRVSLLTQTWRLVLDTWPAEGAIALPLWPVQAVSAVRVVGPDNAFATVDAALYASDLSGDPARLRFVGTPPAPAISLAGIAIEIVAGYGAAADVPALLRHAALNIVAALYENRGDGQTASVPDEAGLLLAPFRRARLT